MLIEGIIDKCFGMIFNEMSICQRESTLYSF